MKFAALAVIATLIAAPALANKQNDQPTASQVKAWQADHAKIKKQEAKKKSHKKSKKHSSGVTGQIKETAGGHGNTH